MSEFKVGDTVHFHAYDWYKPKPRVVAIIWECGDHTVCRLPRKHEGHSIYGLAVTEGELPVNITTGKSIVESKFYEKPETCTNR